MVITPFLLMGAMSPVSVPSTLAQQVGRGAGGHRARPDDPSRLSRRLRLLPLEHRHAVGLAELRHARVGDRAALHRARSRATTGCRSAAAARSPRRRRSTRRRRTSRDDALADVPRRHELRHALGGLARVGSRLLLREVHRRRRAAADAAPRVPAAADQRGDARLQRAPGGGAGRPLPRRRAHARAVPRVLLPPAALLDRELRALEAARRQGRGGAREGRSGGRRSRSTRSRSWSRASRTS